MSQRLNPFAAAPAPMKAWLDFSTGLDGVEPRIAELVKIAAAFFAASRSGDMETLRILLADDPLLRQGPIGGGWLWAHQRPARLRHARS